MGLDSATARAGRSGIGSLAAKLVRTLRAIQVGQLCRNAYESLTLLTNVPNLRRFVRVGISVADVLRTQASEMRLKRHQRAEASAGQGDLPPTDVHAVACALLVAVDLAVFQLPDKIVLPMYPVVFGGLVVASAMYDD